MTYPLIILLLILRSFYWCISLVAQLVKNLPAMQETPVWFLGWEDSPREGIGYLLQYSWASLVVQLVKNPPAMWETWVQSLGWEDTLEKGMATHSSILAWRIPWTIVPWGRKESDTTERLSLYFTTLPLTTGSEMSTRSGRPLRPYVVLVLSYFFSTLQSYWLSFPLDEGEEVKQMTALPHYSY